MSTFVTEFESAPLYVIDTLRLDASDLVTYEYLREHRQEHPPPDANALAQGSSPPGSAEDGESESDTQSMADDDDGDIFKLVVRSGVTKDVTLKVRQTTTCGAIVKAFLKRAGIADQYSESRNIRGEGGARLMIDGERMDPETPISEADLEDGDQVEVDGLHH
jgi:SUMO-like protein